MALIKMLNALAKDVEGNIHRVNWGGCGMFASQVAFQLKHVLNVKDVVLRVGDYESNDGEESINNVRNHIKKNTVGHWNQAGIYFGHIIVEFRYRNKLYHYDTYGGVIAAQDVTKMNGYPLYQDHMTIEEGLQLAYCRSGWNTCFDRDQIPKMLGIIYKHVEQELHAKQK